MATPGVYEVFGELAKLESESEKVTFLKKWGDNFAIKSILQGCYNPNVKFLLPAGSPPYQENDPTMVETRLYGMAKRFNMFVEGGRNIASQTKREMLFIELLESIHPEDAKIVLNMVAKTDPVEGMTQNVAHLAFPDLIPEPAVVVEEVVEAEVVEAKPKPKAKRKPRAKKVAAKKASK